ncbi:hypothetical protein L7F22_003936 [Adiantum nelumboides]|nr:hypothetical protein [Adiantum nelumboides]
MPVRPPSRSGRQDPIPDYLDNPLYLVSNFQPPDPLVPAYYPPIQEGLPSGDILLDIEPPKEPSALPPITRRSSCGSFSTALDDIFNEPAPDSPLTPYQTKIVEEPDMNEFENPIDAVNLNFIGAHTPPPGYATKEEPPLRRTFKEIYRIWIVPALAGVPAFLDNWWKMRRAGRHEASIKAGGKGVGPPLMDLRAERYL